MTDKDVAKRITEVLKDNNVRKDVRATRVTFHITDESGTTKDFTVKKPRTDVLFTLNDVRSFLEAFVAVVTDEMLKGGEVRLRDLGIFKARQRAACKVRHPETREVVDVPAFYYPVFTYATKVRNAVRYYSVYAEDAEKYDEEIVSRIHNSIDEYFEIDGNDDEEDDE